MDAHRVIAEARPMLEDILPRIGLCAAPPLDLAALLEPFSQWVETQEVADADRNFLIGLVGGFICEFLVEHHGGETIVRDNTIYLRMTIDTEHPVARDFEPYRVATGIVTDNRSLSLFLRELTE